MSSLALVYNNITIKRNNEPVLGEDLIHEAGTLISEYLETNGVSCFTQIFERDDSYPMLMILTPANSAQTARQLMIDSPCYCRTFPGLDLSSVITLVKDIGRTEEGIVFQCGQKLLMDFADCLRETAQTCTAPAPRPS